MAVRDKTPYTPGIYFITFTICGWRHVFTTPKYCNLIYKWFDYQKENYQNKINGYVIMPNHFHGLIYISPNSPPLAKLIQNAKRFLAYEIVECLAEDKKRDTLEFFAENARKDKGAKHKVFEERYDSKIVDSEKIFWQKLSYIHNNPCKAPWNLANTPEEYLHSSASNYLDGKGVYTVDVVIG